jgi:hypothetical protein
MPDNRGTPVVGAESVGLHGQVNINSTEYNGVLGTICILLFCIDTFGIPISELGGLVRLQGLGGV